MESENTCKLLIFFVRHGERLDVTYEPTEEEKLTKYPECDPPLTEKGKTMA